MTQCLGWTIAEWREAFCTQRIEMRLTLHRLRDQLEADQDCAWIYLLSRAELDAQLDTLEQATDHSSLPLYGVPFSVKDNIDVAGIPTTAACPAFTYIAQADAEAVVRLKKAGAVVLGKTNLDQFATGLVGTRSPYGIVRNTFNSDYISGGSSSGSAVTVAQGIVPFSLGTDTAGSGRVPAGFNNIVGLKPTRGRFSTKGIVPACRSLDCLSIFALTVIDAELVGSIIEGFDAQDSYSRVAPPGASYFFTNLRFGIPNQLQWFGDTNAERAWQHSLANLRDLGAELLPLDFTPMHQLAQLLYGGAWVAERYAELDEFMQYHRHDMNDVVRSIIENATNFSASDAFKAEYQRADLAREIQLLMTGVDALLVPTTPRHPTVTEVMTDPIGVNSQLGTYTNFVNLADCSALALPAVLRDDGLPFGITLIAPAWKDTALAHFGKQWQASTHLRLGATQKLSPPATQQQSAPAGYIRLAVVGAHLREMPLNSQLRERESIFVETAFTSSNYCLYALPNTTPPKPGLVRVADNQASSTAQGGEILVELWDMPVHHFGSFVALIPAPLGIGTLQLNDGREVKGFICEAVAVQGAEDITHLGGWRAFLTQSASNQQ